jgi:DNA-directed RNA polymerase specialized sigma subunit
MSAIYYVIDPNGDIYSEDKKVRYTALFGEKLDQFMKSEKANQVYFMKTTDEKENLVAIELPKHMVASYRADQDHARYLRNTQEGYQILSLNAPASEDEEESLESRIADPDEDVFEKIARKETIESVRKALKALTEKELLVIATMYLGNEELSEREVSRILGIPQRTIHDIKVRSFKKISNFFEK